MNRDRKRNWKRISEAREELSVRCVSMSVGEEKERKEEI